MVGYTQYPIASMSNLKYSLSYAANHKSRVHQLDFIGSFIQANIKHRVLKLDSRHGKYFLWHDNYSGTPLRLKKSMYIMTNSRKIFSDEIANCLIDESGFNQYKFQMSV